MAVTDTSTGDAAVDTSALGFAAFDADNHYYEALDAFTRYLDPAFRKRGMQWADHRRRNRLLVGGKHLPVHPEPDVRPDRPARLARRLLPGQAAVQRHPGRLRRPRAHRGPARVPRPRRPPRRHGRARASTAASSSRRSASGSRRRSRTTSTPSTPASGPSTAGSRTTGATPTTTASSPPPMLSLADPAQAEDELRTGPRRRGPHRLPAGRPHPHRVRRPLARRPRVRPVLEHGRRGRHRPSATTRATPATAATPTTGAPAARWRRSASTRSARWSRPTGR